MDAFTGVIFYSLVLWGPNGAATCSTGWTDIKQCEAAVGIATSSGRRDLSWNCVPYPAHVRYTDDLAGFSCGGQQSGGR